MTSQDVWMLMKISFPEYATKFPVVMIVHNDRMIKYNCKIAKGNSLLDNLSIQERRAVLC